MKSPDRPRGPSSAVVGATTEVANHTFNRPSSSASSALSFFRAPRSPATSSPQRDARSVSAPSTIHSVFGESCFGESESSTASPSTAHEFANSLENVLEAGTRLSDAFKQLSAASSAFGQALDECSHHKPCGSSSEGVAVAGGLHLLISNHLQILGSAFQSQMLDPLQRNVAEYKSQLSSRETQFRTQLKEAKQALAKAEYRNKQAARQKNRNLQEYRSILLDMTSQIDDIHRLKFEFLCDLYTQGALQAEQLKQGLGQTASAEIEIFESIARKGWSGGGLDNLLQDDPFDGPGEQHFTVLGNNRLLPDLGDADETIKDTIDADDTLEMPGNVLGTPKSPSGELADELGDGLLLLDDPETPQSPTPRRRRGSVGTIDSSDGINEV